MTTSTITISSTTRDAGGDAPADHQRVLVEPAAPAADRRAGRRGRGRWTPAGATAVRGLMAEALSPRHRRRTTKASLLAGIQEGPSMTAGRNLRRRSCNFSLSAAFLRRRQRSAPLRRRTREPVESQRTLVRGPCPQPATARRPRPSRSRSRRAPERPRPRTALLLGRYRLRERLGAGGFGVVWRAHDELLHREVAVKRIALGADGEDAERATREALATARLSHPAIVALYEACAARRRLLPDLRARRRRHARRS